MQESVLVDSNVYIHLLRRGYDPVDVLGSWIEEGDLMTCGMVRLEVERGIISPSVRLRIGRFFDLMLPGVTNRIWTEACDIAWQLDRRGRTLPTQDILIAATAIANRAVVLTDDLHFNVIPDLEVLRASEHIPEW